MRYEWSSQALCAGSVVVGNVRAALFNNVGCLRRSHITGLVGFCCLRLLMCAGVLEARQTSLSCTPCVQLVDGRRAACGAAFDLLAAWCCSFFPISHGSYILARFGASVHAADDMRSLNGMRSSVKAED